MARNAYQNHLANWILLAAKWPDGQTRLVAFMIKQLAFCRRQLFAKVSESMWMCNKPAAGYDGRRLIMQVANVPVHVNKWQRKYMTRQSGTNNFYHEKDSNKCCKTAIEQRENYQPFQRCAWKNSGWWHERNRKVPFLGKYLSLSFIKRLVRGRN